MHLVTSGHTVLMSGLASHAPQAPSAKCNTLQSSVTSCSWLQCWQWGVCSGAVAANSAVSV